MNNFFIYLIAFIYILKYYPLCYFVIIIIASDKSVNLEKVPFVELLRVVINPP